MQDSNINAGAGPSKDIAETRRYVGALVESLLELGHTPDNAAAVLREFADTIRPRAVRLASSSAAPSGEAPGAHCDREGGCTCGFRNVVCSNFAPSGDSAGVPSDERAALEELIADFRLSNWTDGEDGLPLVDRITSGGTIEEGKCQIERLADEIACFYADRRAALSSSSAGAATADSGEAVLLEKASRVMEALMRVSDPSKDRNAEFFAVAQWKAAAFGGGAYCDPLECLAMSEHAAPPTVTSGAATAGMTEPMAGASGSDWIAVGRYFEDDDGSYKKVSPEYAQCADVVTLYRKRDAADASAAIESQVRGLPAGAGGEVR